MTRREARTNALRKLKEIKDTEQFKIVTSILLSQSENLLNQGERVLEKFSPSSRATEISSLESYETSYKKLERVVEETEKMLLMTLPNATNGYQTEDIDFERSVTISEHLIKGR